MCLPMQNLGKLPSSAKLGFCRGISNFGAILVTKTAPSLTPKASPWHTFLTFVFRLLVLGIGMGVASIVGVCVAMWQPDLVWQPNPAALSPKKQVFILSADALFEPNKTAILPDGLKLLDQVAAQLPLSGGKSIRINGHTDVAAIAGDSKGQATSPLDISYLRALAVRDYLMRLRGENSYDWIAVGYGNSRPVANNDTEAHRKSNRRIEITIGN
jgi:outer membrane protein OmpA-like peptidoglycan-associated protein